MLMLEHVFMTYQMGETTVQALKDISLTIESGDFVAIMGPSGSGKSTLMNVLGLLDVPTAGAYAIDGRQVSQLGPDELALIRRQRIGFIFQQFHLLPRMTARENTALPLLYSGKIEDEHRADELLAKVGLQERMGHKTNQLSGGQQQRVAIARSLVNNPSILFADEPTGNLDSRSEKEIIGILKSLNDEGITIIMVTHEEEIGAQAKRRIRMRDGALVSDERLKPIPSVTPTPASVGLRESSAPNTLLLIRDHLRQAGRTLWANKVRTALSMLGIMIGVSAVIAMLAIGQGARQQIEKQLSSLGSNLLILRPGTTRVAGVAQENSATRLDIDDASELKSKIAEIKNTSPTVNGRAQISFANKNWNTQVTGVTPAYADMRAAQPTLGRFFTEQEGQSRARVVLLGTTVQRELFGDINPIGETLKINRISFQIIGVLPKKGATGFRDQDDVVVIPVQTAMHRLLGKTYVDTIEIEVRNSQDIETVQTAALQTMIARHHVNKKNGDEPFQIMNLADIQQALSASSQTMGSLLAIVAAISLIVGGIGIMNIMLVSVTERTREVGLRKAIGGRAFDILLQFLIEAIVMSTAGGTLGILLGWSATLLVSNVLGWATAVTLNSILVSFFFSVTTGVVFGIYPAKRASDLNPIQALRFE